MHNAFDIKPPRQFFQRSTIAIASLIATHEKATDLLVAKLRQSLDQNFMPLPSRQSARQQNDGDTVRQTPFAGEVNNPFGTDARWIKPLQIDASMDNAYPVWVDSIILQDVFLQRVRDGDDALTLCHDAVVPALGRCREVVGRMECRHEADVGVPGRDDCAVRVGAAAACTMSTPSDSMSVRSRAMLRRMT